MAPAFCKEGKAGSPESNNPPRYLRGLLAAPSHILHIFHSFSISYLDYSQPSFFAGATARAGNIIKNSSTNTARAKPFLSCPIHKLGRAVYFMLKNRQGFDMKKFLAA